MHRVRWLLHACRCAPVSRHHNMSSIPHAPPWNLPSLAGQTAHVRSFGLLHLNVSDSRQSTRQNTRTRFFPRQRHIALKPRARDRMALSRAAHGKDGCEAHVPCGRAKGDEKYTEQMRAHSKADKRNGQQHFRTHNLPARNRSRPRNNQKNTHTHTHTHMDASLCNSLLFSSSRNTNSHKQQKQKHTHTHTTEAQKRDACLWRALIRTEPTATNAHTSKTWKRIDTQRPVRHETRSIWSERRRAAARHIQKSADHNLVRRWACLACCGARSDARVKTSKQ